MSATSETNALESAGLWNYEDPGFIGAHDGACMYNNNNQDISGEFSFSFSIPAGSTIDGIEVVVHVGITSGGDDRLNVELQDSASAWNNKNDVPSSDWGCANAADLTFGGSSDLWGSVNWSATHVNSTSFRIRVWRDVVGSSDGAMDCDHATCTVYYSAPAPPPAGVTRSLRRRKISWKPRITKRNIRS